MPKRRKSHRKRYNPPNSAKKASVHVGCNTDRIMAGINVTPVRTKDSFQMETPVRIPFRSVKLYNFFVIDT